MGLKYTTAVLSILIVVWILVKPDRIIINLLNNILYMFVFYFAVILLYHNYLLIVIHYIVIIHFKV